MEAEATQVTAMITNLRKNWVRLESLDNSTVGVTEEDFNRFKKILSEGKEVPRPDRRRVPLTEEERATVRSSVSNAFAAYLGNGVVEIDIKLFEEFLKTVPDEENQVDTLACTFGHEFYHALRSRTHDPVAPYTTCSEETIAFALSDLIHVELGALVTYLGVEPFVSTDVH